MCPYVTAKLPWVNWFYRIFNTFEMETVIYDQRSSHLYANKERLFFRLNIIMKPIEFLIIVITFREI